MNGTIKKHSVNCLSNIIWECLLRFISCQYSWLYNQLLFITPKIIYIILQSLQTLTEWCLGLFDWTQKLLTEVTGPDCLHDVGRSLVSYVGWEGSCLTRESCFHSCQSELELRNTCDYSAESLETGSIRTFSHWRQKPGLRGYYWGFIFYVKGATGTNNNKNWTVSLSYQMLHTHIVCCVPLPPLVTE